MMANSSPLSRAIIWLLVEHAGNAPRDGLQHPVARRVPEQVVDFLEAVEVETEHCKPAPRCQGHLDLLVELLVEAAAIGKPGERVMMREKADMLFGLLARPQVADRDGAVRLAGKIERTQDELDRRRRAVGMVQLAFDRLVRPLEAVSGACASSGKNCSNDSRRPCCPPSSPTETRKAVVDGDDGLAVANQQAFDGGIGEAAHAVGLEFAAPAVAHFDGDAGQAREAMMTKLASATAIASQPAGNADAENSTVGSGTIEAAPIAVK